MGFNYSIEYKPSKDINVVDALYRVMEDEEEISENQVSPKFSLKALSSPILDLFAELKRENLKDEFLLEMRWKVMEGDESCNYKIKDEYVQFKSRYLIPSNSKLIKKILLEFHDSRIGGHSGVVRTMKKITKLFRTKMLKTVQEYVKVCLVCQQTKSSTQKPMGLLMPLLIPKVVWEDISIDFIIGLPTI